MLVIGLAASAVAKTHAQELIQASPYVGAVGFRETTGQIMAREKAQAGQSRTLHVSPRLLPALPDSMSATSAANSTRTPAGPSNSPLGQQTVSPTINFTAANFNDCSGWPPDTMGTIGPAQFITALNGRIRSFDKTTGLADGAINANTDTFFSPVMTPGSNFTTDPRIRYDRLSGRWFIIMIDVPGQQGKLPNRVMIAVSDSGTITGSTVWTFFQFAGDSTNFADYPTLGIDANALYIGANIFSTSSGGFVNTTAFVVQKSSLLSGGPIVVTAFTGLIVPSGRHSQAGPFTAQGVDNFDPAATEGYFIGVDISSTSTLQLRRVTNPGGTPSLSGNVSISVNSFANPINVTVQGTSGTIDALGSPARLLAAHFRNGSLWTSHNVGVNSTGGNSSPDRDGVRWYQLTGIPTGQTPSVVQSGTVFASGSPSLSYWMGTIMVSGQGHAAVGFTAAGASSLLNAATTGRLAGDPAGTMGTPITYTASSSTYNPSDGSSPHRWGDYSYTSLDPSDDMTMWTIQEWCQSSGNGFAVQVAKLLAPPPATPISCSPSTLTQGVANVTLTIQGSTANGAGFFDPGAGFSNHLSLNIDGGGVAVSNINYLNPSNFTAVVTLAANATTGARTITVTNPDGQAVTSASTLLTISSGSNNPPTLAPIPNQQTSVGTTLTYTNTATDPDSPPQFLSFSLGASTANNASINSSTGVFTWTPLPAQLGSNFFTVIVTDNGSPPLSATQTFSVLVLQSNSPPTLAPIADQKVAVGMTLTLTNSATDPDGDQLTFSLGAGAPTNASINSTNGVFKWTPIQSQIGTDVVSVVVTDSGVPTLSATQSFSVVVVQSNSPPVLAPITNREVAVGMTLLITNVATDADGDQLIFSLGMGAATNATINATNGLFSWAPNSTQLGSNQFSVSVTDNGFPVLSATQSFNVLVVPSNSPPVLAPIPNQMLAVGMTLLYTNSASDSDGDQLTFNLGAGAPGNATINATNGVFTWSPTHAQIGSNFFKVVVSDNGFPSLSATQSFSALVVQSNSPPVLAPVTNREVAVGMILLITNVASDADGDRLTFSLGLGAATNATVNATNGLFSWAPNSTQLGSNQFSVIVTDNGFPTLSTTQSFNVLVVPSNSPPVLAPIPNQMLAVGVTLIYTNTATDSDDDQLTFSLGAGAPGNATLNATNGVFTWAPTQAQIGSNFFKVVVSDNGFPSLSATQSFSVLVVQSNSPPVLAPVTDTEVAVGMTLLITNFATDPDGDQLIFNLGTGAATNATINATNGVFSWTPDATQLGSNSFTIVVTDNGFPVLSATQSFNVLVVPSNSPPVLAPIPNQMLAVGMILVYTNTATDSDGDQLTFSLGPGAPGNASLNNVNGVFTWSPNQSQIGSNFFKVIVSDNGFPSLSATQSFSVLVVQSNSPPVLAPIADTEVAVGMTLQITNAGTDVDGDPLTFSLGPDAATNATINATNGVFSWTPDAAQLGSNAFTVVVTDNGFPALSATQSFNVLVVLSNSPPVLTPIPNQMLAVGVTLIYTNSASDADGDQLTFSLGAGAPGNATINATNGVFTWSPTQAQIGSNFFKVIVSDNGFPSLSATQSFSVLVVQSNSPPVLAPIGDTEVAVGMTLLITNLASDADGDQLTFSLGPDAATSATINATNGVFSWTPDTAQLGSNAFTVIVTDNGFPVLSATQSFNVLVVPSNSPPTLAPIPDQTVYAQLTTYFTNSATDPDAGQTLTFSLDPGAPLGATIDTTTGLVVWTPTLSQLGTNSLTVRVTDNGFPNLSDAKMFSITVVAGPVLNQVSAVSNGIIISWSAIGGDTYRVQYKTNLMDSRWLSLNPDVIATNSTASMTDTNLNPVTFYRLQVIP